MEEGTYLITSPFATKDPTPRIFLSTSADGKVVDLWNQDDGSGRQRWHVRFSGKDVQLRIDRGIFEVDSIKHLMLTTSQDGT